MNYFVIVVHTSNINSVFTRETHNRALKVTKLPIALSVLVHSSQQIREGR